MITDGFKTSFLTSDYPAGTEFECLSQNMRFRSPASPKIQEKNSTPFVPVSSSQMLAPPSNTFLAVDSVPDAAFFQRRHSSAGIVSQTAETSDRFFLSRRETGESSQFSTIDSILSDSMHSQFKITDVDADDDTARLLADVDEEAEPHAGSSAEIDFMSALRESRLTDAELETHLRKNKSTNDLRRVRSGASLASSFSKHLPQSYAERRIKEIEKNLDTLAPPVKPALPVSVYADSKGNTRSLDSQRIRAVPYKFKLELFRKELGFYNEALIRAGREPLNEELFLAGIPLEEWHYKPASNEKEPQDNLVQQNSGEK